MSVACSTLGLQGWEKWMDSKGVWDVDFLFLVVDAEGQGSSKAGTGEEAGDLAPTEEGNTSVKMMASVLATSMNACLPCCS